jgi:hypothetical protein
MRNLLLSSFFLLALFGYTGCKTAEYKKLIPYTNEAPQLKPVFGENFNSFLFKANIKIYGRELSGLLVTKQISAGDYRVIFTTELGIKLFDFGFKDSSFTLHYCVPQFDRPKLLKVIKEDIETLLMNNISEKKLERLITADSKYVVYKLRSEPLDHYYYIDAATSTLERIERGKGNKQKVIYHLQEQKDSFPSHISVDHKDMKLQIDLNLLKK